MKYPIILLSLFLSGCATTGQEEQQTIEQLTVSKNYAGLVEVYKSKVIENDQDWDAQQKLAEAYLKSGDVESANFYVQRVIDLSDQPSGSAYFLKGKILAKNFDFEGALQHYSQALALGLIDAELYMQRGIALAQTKKYETALDSFNLARLRGFNETAVKNNIAMVYIYQGDFQSAVDILLPVYEQDTTNSKVSSNLKLSLMKLEATEDSNETSVEIDPEKATTEVEAQSSAGEAEVSAISAEEFFEAEAVNIKSTPSERKYYIQLGAYDNMPEALEKRNELLDTRLPISIKSADLGKSGTWYRLLTGEFDTYRQARTFAVSNKAALASHDYFIQVIK
ncbi:flp pilus assembly protein tadD [Vibrio ishigakensis]|uniref:Flp pilus assembly protein tadD n=1 Tax=Vibrio ishigakensis TaxID=1481914 RepID=A0A0B8PEE7_9VIBR|nr:flp pilus assembly protein tadD [Vibrio ishigakensis]